jgi:hypothetical protein
MLVMPEKTCGAKMQLFTARSKNFSRLYPDIAA